MSSKSAIISSRAFIFVSLVWSGVSRIHAKPFRVPSGSWPGRIKALIRDEVAFLGKRIEVLRLWPLLLLLHIIGLDGRLGRLGF
jgi:hypothetical protein